MTVMALMRRSSRLAIARGTGVCRACASVQQNSAASCVWRAAKKAERRSTFRCREVLLIGPTIPGGHGRGAAYAEGMILQPIRNGGSADLSIRPFGAPVEMTALYRRGGSGVWLGAGYVTPPERGVARSFFLQ